MTPQPVALAIEISGSVKALAQRLGIAPQGISQWKRVPAQHAVAIHEITGVPLHQIRDDVFPNPSQAA